MTSRSGPLDRTDLRVIDVSMIDVPATTATTSPTSVASDVATSRATRSYSLIDHLARSNEIEPSEPTSRSSVSGHHLHRTVIVTAVSWTESTEVLHDLAAH